MVGPLPHVHKAKEGQKSWNCGKTDCDIESNWVVIVPINLLIIIIVWIISNKRKVALNFEVPYLPWLGLEPGS